MEIMMRAFLLFFFSTILAKPWLMFCTSVAWASKKSPGNPVPWDEPDSFQGAKMLSFNNGCHEGVFECLGCILKGGGLHGSPFHDLSKELELEARP